MSSEAATISIDSIQNGDLVKILGETEAGAREVWFGEKLDVEDGQLVVDLISKEPAGGARWVHDEAPQAFPIESVMEVVDTRACGSYKSAWRRFGFRRVTEDGDTWFITYADDRRGVPESEVVGEEDSSDPSDDSDTTGSLCDFIVPDDDAEPFTLAEEDSEFVRETHQAVREFDRWQPNDPRLRARREFVDARAWRAEVDEDNRTFDDEGRIDYKRARRA